MRKDLEKMRIKESLLYLDCNDWHEFKRVQLERVLVIPVRLERKKNMRGGKSNRGVFILIFGYGEIIDSKTRDLIVVWNERNRKFDCLPFVRRISAKPKREKEYEISEATVGKIITELKTFETRVKSLLPNDRIIMPYSVEGIKRAIVHGGFWKDFSKNAIDRDLREKYMKSSLLKAILMTSLSKDRSSFLALSKKKKSIIPLLPLRLQKEKIFLVNDILNVFKNSSFLLLRDIFNEKYQFDSTLTPDPYSVIRSFLRLIGVYPKRQGGARVRQRLIKHDEEAILRYLPQKNVTDVQIKEAFRNQECPDPTSHQINSIRKKHINSPLIPKYPRR